MRLLIITSIFPPEIGGPATYSYQLVQSLNKHYQVTVVTFAKPRAGYQFKVMTVNKQGSSISRQWRLLKTIIKAAKMADLFYVQDPLVVGFVSAIASFFYRKPLVIKFVGDLVWETAQNQGQFSGSLEDFYKLKEFTFSQKLMILMQKLVFAFATKIITPAKYLKNFLQENYHTRQEKIVVIQNGVSFNDKHKINKDSKQATTVARLVPWKKLDGIIQAIEKFPDLKYQIIGDGPQRPKLQALIKRAKLRSRVKLLGNLDSVSVKKALAGSTYFILNSSYEGLPHVLLEAAAYQNVIIAPRLPGIQEVFSRSEAWLFEPGKLETALKKALRQKALSNQKARQAKKKVEMSFNWKTTLSKTVKVLENLNLP